jgi:MFS family permease
MKRWKWIVVLLTILSLGLLVGMSLLTDHFAPHFSFPASWGIGQIQSEHSLPGRPGNLVSSIGALFTLGISGILVLYVAPERVRRVANSFSGKYLRLALFGFLIGILALVVGISSALMIGTFPVTILLIGILFVAGLMGLVALAYAIGRNLLRRAGWQHGSPIYALLLGLLIIVGLSWIPVLGALLFLFFTSLGLGAMILSHFGSGEPWTLKPLLEE